MKNEEEKGKVVDKIIEVVGSIIGAGIVLIVIVALVKYNLGYADSKQIKQPTFIYVEKSTEQPAATGASSDKDKILEQIANAAVQPVETTMAETQAPELSSEAYFESNNGEYDFGYNTVPEDIDRFRSTYLTADAEIMKDNGYEGVDVSFSGNITFAAEYGGSAVADKYWYDVATMSDLDVYCMSDPFRYGEYVVLSAYNCRVFTGDTVTVYGTVIDIDKNGVVYVAAQMIGLQEGDAPEE